jgi:hypothetical protein
MASQFAGFQIAGKHCKTFNLTVRSKLARFKLIYRLIFEGES